MEIHSSTHRRTQHAKYTRQQIFSMKEVITTEDGSFLPPKRLYFDRIVIRGNSEEFPDGGMGVNKLARELLNQVCVIYEPEQLGHNHSVRHRSAQECRPFETFSWRCS